MATDNDLATVESVLIGRLTANLGTLPDTFTASVISFPNAQFTTPQNSQWMRLTINNLGLIDADASGTYEVNRGTFDVQIFYPRGTGSQKALQVGKAVKSLYTAEILSDVVIESVSVSPSPEADSSPWYGVNVTIQFTYEGFTS